MTEYKVNCLEIIHVMMTVDAESESEAIAKAKDGDYIDNDDKN